jgi:hypothetical protein
MRDIDFENYCDYVDEEVAAMRREMELDLIDCEYDEECTTQ